MLAKSTLLPWHATEWRPEVCTWGREWLCISILEKTARLPHGSWRKSCCLHHKVLLNLKLFVWTVTFTKPWHVTGPHVMAMTPPCHHYQFLLALLKEHQCYSVENNAEPKGNFSLQWRRDKWGTWSYWGRLFSCHLNQDLLYQCHLLLTRNLRMSHT